MKKSNHEDVMKVILKKIENKDGCKGRGYFHVISISKINSEVCHGKFQAQHIFKRQDGNAHGAQLITLNTKRKTYFQFLREGRY